MAEEKHFGWRCPGVAAAFLWIVLPLPVPPADSAESCCFTNTRFEGTCTVLPAKGETCQGILEYLNNPMSTGKSYCGGTAIRRGWVLVDCKTKKPMAEEKRSPGTASRSQEILREETK